MINMDVRKLMDYDDVNYRRAKRLVKELGSYEAVTEASYQQLLDVHYIGETTAKSIYEANREEPQSLL